MLNSCAVVARGEFTFSVLHVHTVFNMFFFYTYSELFYCLMSFLFNSFLSIISPSCCYTLESNEFYGSKWANNCIICIPRLIRQDKIGNVYKLFYTPTFEGDF